MKTFPQAFIVFVCTMLLALGDLALAYPGALDTTFGGTGKVTTAIRNVNDFGQAVAMQGDGKIVVAGYSGDNSSGTQTKYDFAVVRYNTDGSLDPSFNGTGKVTTDCGGIFDYGYSVAVQSDGKIVVAGYGSSLVRYNTNGSLDTTFNGTGIVSIPISSANSVALQSDGKIVVAGPSFNGTKGEFDFAVVRYTSTGALDTSFNGTGKATTSVSSGDDQNNVVAVQGDGKILIAGYSDGNGNANFAMVRYTPTGALDTSFNGTGKVITDINGGDIGKCMAVQSDGKIVMGGYTDNGTGNNDLVLVRYNANGMLDTSFNGTGIVTDSINNASAKCLTVQSDGKIVVVGAVIVRYNVDGSLDSKYTAFATFGAGQSVALQSDGKIVVAGYYHNGIQEVFAVARYLGDQPPVVVTSAPTGVTKTDATLNGTVNPNRYATTAHFDYGLTTSYGSTTSDQDMGAGLNTLAISSAITGLTVHTTYHYRLVATNSIGTSASSDATFVTANTNPTAPNGTAAATTGDQQTITLAFPSPDADGDTVTVASVAPGAHLTVNSRNGADVTFTPATNFAGNSTLNYTVSDGFGGTATGAITVTITDNDAPVVTAHANVTAEATGASGATVTYSAAAATDNVGVTSKTYSQNSGTVFPIGTTTVTITAKDAANNAGTGIFTVTVQDTTAPVVAAHPNVTVEATSDAGAMVNYVAATATDAVGVTSVEYSQNSGTVFPIGMTTVTVTAKDAANNTGTATFTVTVRDTTAPVVGTHADVGPVEATSAAGSTVNYTPATATDAVTANPTITYSRNSGTVFPIGTTTVTVTAKDAANNSGTGTFKVTVRDTTAPTISAPESGFAPLTLTVSQGGKVALPNFTTQAVTSDNVGVSSVTQSPAPATPIAEGTTQVTLTAHDAAANTAVLSFTITVLVSGKATVVTKGAAVPGAGVDPRIPAGTTWGAFGVPTITMEGMKAGWLASALTPPRGSFHGIFTGSILAPTLRLRTGDFAMDQAGTVVAGVTFKSFREPVFAGDDFAVVAMVKGLHVSAANDTGMWFGEGGTVKEIAREGAVAPGTSVKFKAFTSLAMPTPGTVFFVATLAAPATKDMSLWVWTPADGLKLALRDGDSVPSAGGAILKSFVALSSVNGSFGHGRYDADAPALDVRLSFADPDHTTAMGTVATDGSVMVTQRSGQTDPNGRVPVSFGVPSSPGQGLGATAVTTFAPDAAHGITPTSMVTIYDYEDGLIRAQQGMIAPGAEPTTFKSFRDPVSGYGFDGGRVQFFAATLAGAVRTGDTGLWAFTSSLAPVAREGAEPPGAVGTKWKSFTSLSVLEGRGPMFTAKLASGTERVTAANDAGLWAMDSTGALRLIFRKGDVLPGGKLKSFTLLGAVTGSPGQRRAWTIGDASARVIYLAFFTDGSSAILSTAVP